APPTPFREHPHKENRARCCWKVRQEDGASDRLTRTTHGMAAHRLLAVQYRSQSAAWPPLALDEPRPAACERLAAPPRGHVRADPDADWCDKRSRHRWRPPFLTKGSREGRAYQSWVSRPPNADAPTLTNAR